WSADAVDVAQAEGIMEGYPDGSFRGDGQVTRYEMAVIAQRLLARLGQTSSELGVGGPGESPTTGDLVQALENDLTAAGANRGEVSEALQVLNDAAADGVTVPAAIPGNADWPDIPSEHWANDAVATVTGAGIMNGYPDNTFQGDTPLTRYEIAVIAARLLGIAQAQPAADAPTVADVAPAPTQPDPPVVVPTVAPTVTNSQLTREAKAHLLGLKSQLMLSGMSEDEADRALAPARQAMLQGEPPSAPPTPVQPATPTQPVDPPDTQADLPSAPSTKPATPVRTNPAVQEPNMLGVSGFLLTPSADTVVSSDSIKVGVSRVLGSNIAFATTGVLGEFEVGMGVTSGDMPSRILLNAKKQVWRSSDGRSRIAVGILDATDEIDTTVYGAYSKSFQSSFWTDEKHDWTLTVGLGGGDLLDGIFASAYAPVNDDLAVGAEVVDFGDSGNQLNYGFEYKLGRGWQIKGGMVDGDLAAQATIELGL
ncbi:MAG TPA: S-layer homology domain-containing protein, partial [Armatimonadota bacterium]|nr:S-layer homology domain-containing protein [Armatimonadota bacterium]